MNIKERVFLIISLALNLLAATFLTAAFTAAPKTGAIAFQAGENPAAAAVVAFPEGAQVTFNPVGIALAQGQAASLQFSAVLKGRQSNWYMSPLYDRAVISVEPAPYGITITALAQGDAVIQAFDGEGFKDIARVTVTAAHGGAE
jgi:hypothetical protein